MDVKYQKCTLEEYVEPIPEPLKILIFFLTTFTNHSVSGGGSLQGSLHVLKIMII